ncbi:MAG: hypothetical protein IJU59_02420 [Firmicutes bacterium]|nr:hypothetical protein [Bacillota bacterium]
MYNIGEMVIYGESGVCRITDITERTGANDVKAMYYTMQPCYQGYTIYAPVENGKVFMRPIISKEEAIELIDKIPTIKAEIYQGISLRELVERYESMVKTHSCDDLCQLTMSIHAKKQQCIRNKRKVGAVDEKYMKKAEDLLFGELAVVLDIPKNEVPQFIEKRIGSIMN